jgi:WD40 repeat protein
MNFPTIIPLILLFNLKTIALPFPLPFVTPSCENRLSSCAHSPIALSTPEINTIAEQITVRIEGPKGGSGAIVEKQGNTYYILTNWHVVDKPGDYEVITADGKRHAVYYSLIRRVPGMDLAIAPFSSNDNYPVAKLGNSDQIQPENPVYVAGWPTGGGSLRKTVFIFSEGKVTSRQSPWQGYTLVYNNLVRAGMSGGPVLAENGQIVAINGIVKLEDNSDRIVAAGIEINRFWQWRATVKLPIVPNVATPTPSGTTNVSSIAPGRPQEGGKTGKEEKMTFALAGEFQGPTGVVTSVAVSSSHIVTAHSSGAIVLWDRSKGELVKTLRAHQDAVNSIAIVSLPNQSKEVLVSGSDDQTIKIWNLETGENLRTLKGHTDAVVSVAVSPDGKFIASGSWDKTIKIWNLETGELLHTLTGNSTLVNTVKFSPDGKILASGGKEGAIKLWNVKTGQLIKTLKGSSLAILSIVFTPDSTMLVSGNADGSISLWNGEKGQLIRQIKGHNDGVWSIVISEDGKTLISSSWDKTIKLWNLASGELKGTLKGHTAYINSIALSPDDKFIISGGWDGQIKIWQRGN